MEIDTLTAEVAALRRALQHERDARLQDVKRAAEAEASVVLLSKHAASMRQNSEREAKSSPSVQKTPIGALEQVRCEVVVVSAA